MRPDVATIRQAPDYPCQAHQIRAHTSHPLRRSVISLLLARPLIYSLPRVANEPRSFRSRSLRRDDNASMPETGEERYPQLSILSKVRCRFKYVVRNSFQRCVANGEFRASGQRGPMTAPVRCTLSVTNWRRFAARKKSAWARIAGRCGHGSEGSSGACWCCRYLPSPSHSR